MEKAGVVSQKLFANWEPDRTASNAIQRVVSFSVTRLFLGFPTQAGNSLVLTAKLQGNKRTLRSNDIGVTIGGISLDVNLVVSFTIQYPHYIKHKNNVLQIMVQRKRKYKNRPIPGGFKTLATGIINLSQLLQHGVQREILLFASSEDLDKELGTVTSVGRLSLSSCQTVPLDVDETKIGKKNAIAEQDEDEEDSESDYDDVADDAAEPSSARLLPEATRIDSAIKSKLMRRKNLKQRFINLLRKFRAAEETREGIPSRAGSVLGAPTAQELEALFEELEEMSDSDPGEFNDDMSIRSNPRPALRPYFTRSKEVLPILYDHVKELISDTEDNDPSDVELSSDDKEIAARIANSRRGPFDTTATLNTPPRPQNKVSNTVSAPLTSVSGSHGVPHSQTTGSIHKKDSRGPDNLRHVNLLEEVPKMLENVTRPVKIWLCATECGHLNVLGLPTVYCTNVATAKGVLGQVVTRIQHFCNTNSENPPVHLIGIIGSDKTISHVLRAYVEIFNMKSTSPCLPFIRFVIVPPPSALISHLLEDLDPLPEELCRDIWERWPEMGPEDQAKIGNRLEKYALHSTGCVQIPYGEVMLQMSEGNETESGQIFVPFLSEVRMGQNDEDFENNSPRLDDNERTRELTSNSSPPCSPHIKADACDLNLEYWLANDSSTEGSKKDKGSLKTAFRSVLIARMWNQPHLYLNFVKEKKNQKMLLKLGMKKGQKSETEAAPVHVTNVSRLLCIGSGKNNDLTVTVDGNQYRHVRYFQTTAQWQTHIKSFPIAAQLAASGLSYI